MTAVDHEVLVVGGGQAGLAVGYHLLQRDVDFLIVDAGPAIGHSWRSRWDSLKLFTPAQYANLPGRAFPAPTDTYPGRDQVADYLGSYATWLEPPLRLNTRLTRLETSGDHFRARTAAGSTITARQVVIATGPFSQPFVPPVATGLAAVVQVHTADYRNPTRFPDGVVLVVGGGNSGFQIAAELASAGRRVVLSEGRQNACVPQRPLGRDIFWWQDRLGLLRVAANSPLGRKMQANYGTVIGSSRRQLTQRGVSFRPRLVGGQGRLVGFSDGSSLQVDAVLWATGFVIDDSWIGIDGVLDDWSRLRHERGVVTGAAGLYTVGRPWHTTIGSALLGFVQHDARTIAQQITTTLPGHS